MSELSLILLDMLRKGDAETKVGELAAVLEGMVVHAECRWCAQPISRFQIADDRPWVHDDPSRMRGCRAASFDDDGWNDAIPADKKATPKADSIRERRGLSLDPA